ncbi:MAG: aspartate kinase [Alphaproteobacteria bacterium]|nr:aspartate kinase [Rickettsiales bacterium]
MITVKIGGVLVGTKTGIDELLQFINDNIDHSPVIVTSAVKSCTNLLVDIVHEVAERILSVDHAVSKFANVHSDLVNDLKLDPNLLKDIYLNLKKVLSIIYDKKKTVRSDIDSVLRFGEDAAVCIISNYFKANNIDIIPFYGEDTLITTNDSFGSAEVIMEKTISNIKNCTNLTSGAVPIITGFVGKTTDGRVSTTGRNSSDYTACIIAGALGCDAVYIFKDVCGIMSADPAIVSDANRISHVSFNEALEISELGGRVIHPKAVRVCSDFGIKVQISKPNENDICGTIISAQSYNRADFLAIGCKKNISIINISSSLMVGAYGFLERIFRVFTFHRVVVDVVSTSQSSVSVTVDNYSKMNKNLIDKLLEDLREIGDVKIFDNCATIGVVSNWQYLSNSSKLLQIFGVLQHLDVDVKIISQSVSGASVSFVVDSNKCDQVVCKLHKTLFSTESLRKIK